MRTLLLPIALGLAGCGDDRPPPPTAEQAEQLNEAERMLDEAAANEKGPEQSPGPPRNAD